MFHRKLLRGIALLAALAPAYGWAQSQEQKIQELDGKIEDLDQRLKIAERLRELKDEERDTKAKSAATVTADSNGFAIRSADGSYTLKIGADLQVDNRTYVGAGSALSTDSIVLRRARPTFSGTIYKYVDYLIRPDFGGGSTAIYDAYVELKYFARAKLRVGKFKPPVGLERLQSDDDTNFVERGLPTLLVPSRDIGYQISGDIVKRRINYSVGVFNGVPDNGMSDTAGSGHRDFAARLYLTPLQPAAENPLSGLGFGVGVSGGGVDGIATPSYRSFGQSAFLPFASGVTSAGHRTRLAPQAVYYLRSLGVLAEYTLTEEGFRRGSLQRSIPLRAWQVQVAYILTGEKKTAAGVAPGNDFDPSKRRWGAVELAVRLGDFSAGKAIYDYAFADPAKAARRAHEWAGGVNWYLNRFLRLSLDYGATNFSGGAAQGDRPPERAAIGRFQINFN